MSTLGSEPTPPCCSLLTSVSSNLNSLRRHTVYLEAGAETSNVIANNLVALTREAFAGLNTELTPGGFVLTNFANTLLGNSACESHGYGFWYQPFPSKVNMFNRDVCPHKTVVTTFLDNVAHGNAMGGMAIFSLTKEPIVPLADECNHEESAFATSVFNVRCRPYVGDVCTNPVAVD